MLNPCKICFKEAAYLWNGLVLSKYKVNYFFCSACEFLFTEDPYWLEEAYSAPIVALDTGLLARNALIAKRAAVLIYLFFNSATKNDRYLDYAGGYGVFTRLMRDMGYDFYWQDLYAPNLFAQGFDVNTLGKEKFALLTSFESFEHFPLPLKELDRMFEYSENILFSTSLLPRQIPALDEWWYYVPITGQHISFYGRKTLKILAARYGKHLNSYDGLHLFSSKPISERSFKYAIKYSDILFKFLVSKKMQSKTFADFEYLRTHFSEKTSENTLGANQFCS